MNFAINTEKFGKNLTEKDGKDLITQNDSCYDIFIFATSLLIKYIYMQLKEGRKNYLLKKKFCALFTF